MQRKVEQSTVTVRVPDHKELRVGTLLSIIRQSGLPRLCQCEEIRQIGTLKNKTEGVNMYTQKRVTVAVGICVVSMILVINCAKSYGFTKAVINESKEDSARSDYLNDLWCETNRDAKERISSRSFEDAVNLVELNMKEIEGRDYEQHPALVAKFYATMASTNLEAANYYMDQARQSRAKSIELYEKSGDLLLFSLATSSLADCYFLQGDLKIAEETYKQAISYAKTIPSKEDEYPRYNALFQTKMALMNFYHFADRNEEAKEIAEELEMMIAAGQIREYTRQDIEDMIN